MKRNALALLAGILLISGCSTKTAAKDVDVKELMNTIVSDTSYELPAMQELTDTDLESLYGISVDDLEAYSVNVPMMNVTATEIALFHVKDGKMDTVKKGVETRMTQLESTWSQYLPAQYDLVKDRRIIESGNYYFVIISEYADTIEATCKAALE